MLCADSHTQASDPGHRPPVGGSSELKIKKNENLYATQGPQVEMLSSITASMEWAVAIITVLQLPPSESRSTWVNRRGTGGGEGASPDPGVGLLSQDAKKILKNNTQKNRRTWGTLKNAKPTHNMYLGLPLCPWREIVSWQISQRITYRMPDNAPHLFPVLMGVVIHPSGKTTVTSGVDNL